MTTGAVVFWVLVGVLAFGNFLYLGWLMRAFERRGHSAMWAYAPYAGAWLFLFSMAEAIRASRAARADVRRRATR
ncbi:MAG: hypothetical protein NVSMB57_10170 [Actinomycetota bacterium]